MTLNTADSVPMSLQVNGPADVAIAVRFCKVGECGGVQIVPSGGVLRRKFLYVDVAMAVGLHVIEFEGAIEFDLSLPDGIRRKLKDLVWLAMVLLDFGLKQTYAQYIAYEVEARS